MMEETPRTTLRDVDPSTLWVAYGVDSAACRRRRAEAVRTACIGSAARTEGYAYVFPKRDHVNVGIGYVLEHFRDAIDEAPYDLQRRFVDHLRGRGVMEGESSRRHFTPFIIPGGWAIAATGEGPRARGRRCRRIRQRLHGRRDLLRDGVRRAGRARALLDHARALGPSDDGRYAAACESEMGQELRESVLIQRTLFADRRRIARIITGVAHEPVLTRAILACAAGRLRYAELRRRLIARAPLFAIRLAWERLRPFGRPPGVLTGTSGEASGAT